MLQGNGSISMALSHISYVLKQSGTNAKEYGSTRIASLQISCVFRLSEISLIHTGIISSRDISIHALGPRQGSNFMDRKNDTMHRVPWGGHFIDAKNL